MEAGLPLDESYLECDLPEILADLIGKHEEVMGD